MKVINQANISKDTSSMPIFTGGEVKVQPLVNKDITEDLNLGHVHFSAGARNKLHIHSRDQVLLIMSGKGIEATETEENVVTPGMLVHIPREERHWHGATKDTAMSHISVMPGGVTTTVVE